MEVEREVYGKVAVVIMLVYIFFSFNLISFHVDLF